MDQQISKQSKIMADKGYDKFELDFFGKWEVVKDEILLPERKTGSGNGTIHIFLGGDNLVKLKEYFPDYFAKYYDKTATDVDCPRIKHFVKVSNLLSVVGHTYHHLLKNDATQHDKLNVETYLNQLKKYDENYVIEFSSLFKMASGERPYLKQFDGPTFNELIRLLFIPGLSAYQIFLYRNTTTNEFATYWVVGESSFENITADLTNFNFQIEQDVNKDIVIQESSSIRDFALSVFEHFYKNNWADFLEQTKTKFAKLNSESYISHDFNSFIRLIGEFSTTQKKEVLSSAGTLRFFEKPIHEENDRYFYFSNQWFGKGGDSLSFNTLQTFFESNYPEYKFEKTDTTYKLIKKGSETLVPFDYKAFHVKTQEAGLFFTEKIVSRFVASLCTKPFIICSGLSGSGKTKLAQSFVQWICQSDEQYKIVPVGADWTNREPLLGFPNGLDPLSYISPDSGVLQLILDAINLKNKDKPYFLILDEMNLSHVERYFADFLSIMESQDKIKLYFGGERDKLPNEIFWPKNLFIIGTVNVDETTYMFSPKVLDRANVIEFRITDSEIEDYLAKPVTIEMGKFTNLQNNQGYGVPMAASFLNTARTKAISNIPTKENLLLFFKELKKAGAEFGYRSASEINRLIAILDTLTKDNKIWDGFDIETDEFVDIAIMQKLLPKLHGSRNKLTKVLPLLGCLCLNDNKNIKEDYFDKFDSINFAEDKNIKYRISFEKISRMYRNAIENGFASYAEA